MHLAFKEFDSMLTSYRRLLVCILVNRSLKPLHNARMSGYMFFCSSKAFGTTFTAHCCTRACWPALKQRKKYPGCRGSIQKLYTDRFGLASVYVVNQRSIRGLAYSCFVHQSAKSQ